MDPAGSVRMPEESRATRHVCRSRSARDMIEILLSLRMSPALPREAAFGLQLVRRVPAQRSDEAAKSRLWRCWRASAHAQTGPQQLHLCPRCAGREQAYSSYRRLTSGMCRRQVMPAGFLCPFVPSSSPVALIARSEAARALPSVRSGNPQADCTPALRLFDQSLVDAGWPLILAVETRSLSPATGEAVSALADCPAAIRSVHVLGACNPPCMEKLNVKQRVCLLVHQQRKCSS